MKAMNTVRTRSFKLRGAAYTIGVLFLRARTRGQRRTEHADVISDITLLDLGKVDTKKRLERKFTTPSECEVFSGGLSRSAKQNLGFQTLREVVHLLDISDSKPGVEVSVEFRENHCEN